MLALGVTVAITWILLRLDPLLREQRVFEVKLRERAHLNDVLFAAEVGGGGEVYVAAARVRALFARHTGYPVAKLLPDDDLGFFWAELDAKELIDDFEREFGVAITKTEAERTRCTIRAVTLLVVGKLSTGV